MSTIDNPAQEIMATPHPRPRILVVDDNTVNRQIVARMIEKLGCEAHMAANGLEAVAAHARHRYDLMLMDCQMPELDGYQATIRIRAAEGRSYRTPIIALSANLPSDARAECLAAGMDELLIKPLRVDVLQQVLSQWLPELPATEASRDNGSADDQAQLMRQLHGEGFAELAELFNIDSRRRLMALRTACTADDLQNMAKAAHALCGSCASIGAKRLARLCEAFEKQCRSGGLDDWRPSLEAIDAEYLRTWEAMKRACVQDMDS